MNTENTPQSGQPHVNETAAFLFDEPNPIIEEALGGSTEPVTVTPSIDEENQLMQQSAAELEAANEEPVVVNTPAPVVQAAPVIVQPQVQIAPQVQQQQYVVPVQPVVQQVAPQVVQPTEAEIRQTLNIHEVSQADYDAIFKVDDEASSIKALNDLLDKKVRQAVTMSQVLMQEQTHRISETVQPYMQFADEQRQQMWEQTFFSRHADLSSAKPVVDAVVAQMRQQGVKYPTVEQAFDAVAQNTKAYLSQMAQLGQTVAVAPAGPAPTQRPTQVKPKMVALPTGGQSGAGAGGSQNGKVNTAQMLFG